MVPELGPCVFWGKGEIVHGFCNWSTRVFFGDFVLCFLIAPRVSGVWTLKLYPFWPQLWWWAGGGKRVVVVPCGYFVFVIGPPVSGVWTLILYPIWPQLWWWAGGGKRVVTSGRPLQANLATWCWIQ